MLKILTILVFRSKYFLKITNTGIFLLFSLFLISNRAKAQLIPDNTLGKENSRVVPASQNRDNIEGGALRGSNLFHSFQEFNVNEGRQVYFNNPTEVQNILTRVTGNNISNILGTLGVYGNANLYLINPNGIVFGNGAKLDVNSTFIGTTAEGVKLGSKDIYSATNPNDSTLLTLKPGVLFVDSLENARQRTITNRGILKVNSGANLTLSADEINNNGSIFALGGDVFLEAVNGDINVKTIVTNDDVNGGGDLTISASGSITVDGVIDVSGGDLDVDNSWLGTFGFIYSIPDKIANSGDIIFLAEKDIIFNNNSSLSANGSISGNINFESRNKLLASDSHISSISVGNVVGKGGDIKIKASSIEFNKTYLNSVSFRPGEVFLNNTEIIGVDTGNITIDTDYLRLVNGALININTWEERNAGNLIVNAKEIEIIGSNTEDLLLRFSSSLSTSTSATRDGGNIIINTDFLRLIDGGDISTWTEGDGGNIAIFANKNIELFGKDSISDLSSSISGNFGKNNGGNITIKTDYLRLFDGARITMTNFTQGNPGNLNISAKNIELSGINTFYDRASGIFFDGGLNFADGTNINAGNINIDTNQLKILNGATIQSISSYDSIEVRNSDLISDLFLKPFGIQITGIGKNSNINIAAEEIFLNRGKIIANSNFLRGGDININSSNYISLQNQSEISTNVGEASENPGGNININTPIIIGLPNNNRISATAMTSQGGKIKIDTKAILGYPQFLIVDATSNLGIDGSVTIAELSDEITKGSLLTPTSAIDAEDIMNNDVCAFKDGKIAHGSSFTIIGKGGIVPNPLENVDRTRRGIVEWTQRPEIKANIKTRSIPTKQKDRDDNLPKKILSPAVGWYRQTDGTVVLTDDPAKIRPLNKPIDYPTECFK